MPRYRIQAVVLVPIDMIYEATDMEFAISQAKKSVLNITVNSGPPRADVCTWRRSGGPDHPDEVVIQVTLAEKLTG